MIFHPDATSAVILRTGWAGRRVLGMSEGVSGLLDGVNDAGVAAALTFGGRHVYGAGFSIVQIIRYLLQVASDVEEAAEVLRRVPCAWAQNVLVQDRSGKSIRAELAPDRAPLVVQGNAVANHQADVDPATGFSTAVRAGLHVGRLMRNQRVRFLLRAICSSRISMTGLERSIRRNMCRVRVG